MPPLPSVIDLENPACHRPGDERAVLMKNRAGQEANKIKRHPMADAVDKYQLIHFSKGRQRLPFFDCFTEAIKSLFLFFMVSCNFEPDLLPAGQARNI